MNIFFIPIGSAGDVFPFIGIARELKRRGHSCTIITNDHFRDMTLAEGLDFVASSRMEDYQWVVDDPRLWNEWTGFEFVARSSFLPVIAPVYNILRERYVPGETLAVGCSLAWGARIAQEKFGLPLVTVHLQPTILNTVYETPVFSGLGWVSRLPRGIKRKMLELMFSVADGIVAPEINKFRASVGLPAQKNILQGWSASPLRSIGLFPEWFAPVQPDWPVNLKLSDFPLYDGAQVKPVPPEVDAFLNNGAPPVIFTAGSAMKQAAGMFRVSVQACRELSLRGILVSNFPEQFPADLPRNVIGASYVPFSQVFRRASAVVHHGGIGTTAQVLAAGVPQLVTPFAHDQFDNAARVKRLGIAEVIPSKRYELATVTDCLRRLMSDPAIREKAKAVSARLNGSAAISTTCDLVLDSVRKI